MIQLWNAAAETLFDYSSAEVTGQSLDLIIPERLRNRQGEGGRYVIRTGEMQYSQKLLAVPAVRKDEVRISTPLWPLPSKRHRTANGRYRGFSPRT